MGSLFKPILRYSAVWLSYLLVRIYILNGDISPSLVIAELSNLFSNHMENNFDTRYLCIFVML